jgi:NAD(P)-dependent dehydrogenase (short-subunit alcohol dehydrogenase family)
MQEVLITGANGALGSATARVLLARGVPVRLACRRLLSAERTRAALLAIGAPPELTRVAQLDVSELASVRRLASEFERGSVGGLVCNAGIQLVRGTRRTADGLEETFATNHLGHFLLARSLLPALAPGARVVFVTSNTHDPRRCTGMPAPRLEDLAAVASGDAFADERAELAGRRRYTTSKLCNVLCAYELGRRVKASRWQIEPVAFDPGLMPGTGLAREYGPLASWAWHHLLPAVTSLLPNVNSVSTSAARLAKVMMRELDGDYISNGRAVRSSLASYDQDLARRLWDISSSLAGIPSALA